MDFNQKVQLVLDVIDGRAHPSVLKPVLPEAGQEEPNFIKAAVDHMVILARQRGSSGKAQFRFKVVEHGAESFTDWKPEMSQFDASMAMGQLRQQRPQAEISIERHY